MAMTNQNIYENLPEAISEEMFDDLITGGDFRLERILSKGQSTPLGEWLEQETHEWVLLLKGRATLLFAEGSEILEMTAGDYVHIPAHTPHRVEWTDSEEATLWLALHYL